MTPPQSNPVVAYFHCNQQMDQKPENNANMVYTSESMDPWNDVLYVSSEIEDIFSGEILDS